MSARLAARLAVSATKPRYVVFTVCATLDTKVCLPHFAKTLPLPANGRVKSIKYLNKNTGYSLYRHRDGCVHVGDIKAFNNQVTMEFFTTDGKCVNVKLFRNGKLQMTGCRNVQDGADIAMAVTQLLADTPHVRDPSATAVVETAVATPVTVVNVYVGMINALFSINFMLNRDKLVSLVRELYAQDIERCIFEVNNYQGVLIKKRSRAGNLVTLLIFRSGKILITGGKSIADITEMHEFMARLCDQHRGDIATTNHQKTHHRLARLRVL